MKVNTSSYQREDILSVLKSMMLGIVDGHYLGYLQFKVGLKSEWAQSVLGTLWNFLEPLVLAIVFYVIKSNSNVDFGVSSLPFVVYVYIGIVSFQLFFRSLSIALNGIIENGKLLKQVKITPEVFIWSGLYRSAMEGFYGYIILIVLLLYTNAFTFMGLLVFIVPYLVFTFLGFFLGIFLAPFNAVTRDVSRMIMLWSRPLMFISPTFMVFDEGSFMSKVNKFNPLGAMMNLERDCIANSWHSDIPEILIWSLSTVFVAGISTLVFRIAFPIVSEKLS